MAGHVSCTQRHAAMSLSVAFKPLPTLQACYSVPIEWFLAGNATAAQQGQVKLVFVSAQSSVSRSEACGKGWY